MTDAELIAACQQVAELSTNIARFHYALKAGCDTQEQVQRWHDNRIVERSEVLDLIRNKLGPFST